MEITFNRTSLVTALGLLNQVAEAKSPSSAMQSVLIRTDGHTVTMTATSANPTVLSMKPDATVKAGGAVLVNAARTLAIVKELDCEEVEIKLDGTVVQLKGGKSKFRLPTESIEQFPVWGADNPLWSVTIDSSKLRRLVNRSAFAAADEASRYALNSVKIEYDCDDLRFIGTDGKVMSVATESVENDAGDEGFNFSAMVSSRLLQTASRLIVDDATQVKMDVGKSTVSIELVGKGIRYTVRQSEGRFPKWQDVIPNLAGVEVGVNTELLVKALRQAKTMTSQESRGVRFELDGDELSFAAQSADFGACEVKMAVNEVLGTDKANLWHFDPQLWIDGLKATDADSVTLQLDGTKAAKMQVGGFLYVVMPLALDARAAA